MSKLQGKLYLLVSIKNCYQSGVLNLQRDAAGGETALNPLI